MHFYLLLLGAWLSIAPPTAWADKTSDDAFSHELLSSQPDSQADKGEALTDPDVLTVPSIFSTEWLVCTQESLEAAPDTTTLGEIRQLCSSQKIQPKALDARALDDRLVLEGVTENNPFVITPYRRNYVLPLSYWSNPGAHKNSMGEGPYRHLESKFQLSIKVPIADLGHHFKLYGAFTGIFFWQSYSGHISRPFREINYEPEVFVTHPFRFDFGPIESKMLMLGVSHQSNGQDVPFSRSWNRVYMRYVFATGPWYWSVKPWWRIPEKRKQDPARRSGDDNPDIEHYYGHATFRVTRKFSNHVLEGVFHNNFHKRNNAGSAEISYTFPLNHRFKGLVQAFTGYGDSMVTYNHYENRFSFGVLLTDIL